MAVAAHVQELRKKHQILSEQVEEALRHPGSDGLQISAMKKQKMRLKEEIERLSN